MLWPFHLAKRRIGNCSCSLNIVPQCRGVQPGTACNRELDGHLRPCFSSIRIHGVPTTTATRRRWALSPSLTRGRASTCAYSSCASTNTLHRHHTHRRRHRRSPRSFTHAPVAAMQDKRHHVSLWRSTLSPSSRSFALSSKPLLAYAATRRH